VVKQNLKMMKTKLFQFILVAVGFMAIGTSCNNEKAEKNAEELEASMEEMADDMEEGMEKAGNAVKEEYNELKAETKSDWSSSDAYNVTQVDRPPLMDQSCVNASNPMKCSEEKILAYIQKNVKVPNDYRGASLEQVLVIIDENGKIENVKYVASGDQKACKGCQQAAVDVVSTMNNWIPAMKDGKAVPVKMTIPVKFG